MSKTHDFKNIVLIELFCGEINQSVLQPQLRRSVGRIVILTICHITEFHEIKDFN